MKAYAKIPQSVLENKQLSLEARLVLAWLIGRPKGWKLSVSHLCHTLGLGSKKWRQIRRELETHGFLIQKRKQSQNGKYYWTHSWFAIPPNTMDGESMGGDTTLSTSIDSNKDDLKERVKDKEKGGKTIVTKKHSFTPRPQRQSDFQAANSGIQAFLSHRKGEKS